MHYAPPHPPCTPPPPPLHMLLYHVFRACMLTQLHFWVLCVLYILVCHVFFKIHNRLIFNYPTGYTQRELINDYRNTILVRGGECEGGGAI